MSLVRAATVAIAAIITVNVVSGAAGTPRAFLVSAPEIELPGAVDSNSPVVWDLEEGQHRQFVFTSYSGVPSLSSGLSLERLTPAEPITITPHPGYGVWMEGVVSDDVDTWYGLSQRVAGVAMRPGGPGCAAHWHGAFERPWPHVAGPWHHPDGPP